MTYAKVIDVLNMPDRIRQLPIDSRGFPVPWFVTWFQNGKPCAVGEGTPDFRVADTSKLGRAVKENRCWVCGTRGGTYKAFVIGPMCAIGRVISEPPSHRDCAIWSAKNCPFLANPAMRRNDKGLMENGELRDGLVSAAGMPIERNPGAVCVWVTKAFTPFRPYMGADGVLFRIGDPIETIWFAKGRRATRDEVVASIDSGYPQLVQVAIREGPEAVAALPRQREIAMKLLPEATT